MSFSYLVRLFGNIALQHSTKQWNSTLIIAVLASGIAIALFDQIANAAQPYGAKPDITIVEIGGTPLYVPTKWMGSDWYKRPVGGANELWLGFCRYLSGQVDRRTIAPELPTTWCIETVRLKKLDDTVSLRGAGRGPDRIPKRVVDTFGEIDENGFRKKLFDSTEKTGVYYGFRNNDISPMGGPIRILCRRPTPHVKVFTCQPGGFADDIAVPGIYAERFYWEIDDIDPERLRDLFWSSQYFLEWLATPPERRPAKIEAEVARRPR